MDYTPVITGAASIILATAGIGVGRASIRWSRKHKNEEAEAVKKAEEEKIKRDRLDAERDNTILELTYAVNGRPATPWAPATPGIRHGMEEMSAQLSEHRKQDDLAFRKLTERLDHHERTVHS